MTGDGETAADGRGPRWWAAAFGLSSHALFVVAIAMMAIGLHTGMGVGLGRVPEPWAVWANLLLLLQFPLFHSGLLSAPGRALMGRLLPEGRTLMPTTFALFASLQVLSTFALWTPTGDTWWQPEGQARIALWIVDGAAWLFLGKALWDAGLGLQTGWIGWTAALRRRRPTYPGLPTGGLFRRCRQPIYLGFAMVLWTGPVWNGDHLLIAITWSGYCALGPILKEQRFARIYGEAFSNYRSRVPYLLPRLRP